MCADVRANGHQNGAGAQSLAVFSPDGTRIAVMRSGRWDSFARARFARWGDQAVRRKR